VHISRLALTDFRSYRAAEVSLGPGASTFLGANGQGKTNLVEAAAYVATLGSHRVASDAPLVRRGADQAVLRARVVSAGRDSLVEIEINAGRANRARLNRAPVRPRQVLGVLRTVLFAPEDLALVKGDPEQRRRFLDDLLAARAPRYAAVRSDYERVLKQRTALLKTLRGRAAAARPYAGAGRRRGGGSGDEPAAAEDGQDMPAGSPARMLEVWDEQLVTIGAELLAGRLRLTALLRPLVNQAYAAVAGGGTEVGITYRRAGIGPDTAAADPADPGSRVPVDAVSPPPGAEAPLVPGGSAGPAPAAGARPVSTGSVGSFSAGAAGPLPLSSARPPDRGQLAEELREALVRVRGEELERGVCLIGPHRDDLELRIGDLPSRGYASQGESWSTALALRLASYELLRATGDDPVLLLDDVFAELDAGRRDRVASLVAGAEQVLVTAAVPEDVPPALAGTRFEVAEGTVVRGG
jgi:DNA replication and repair protein RecF